MHPFGKKSFDLFKECYIKKFNNPKIVDIGALDINGSIKDQINFKSEYIGLDLCKGKNVNMVLKDPYKFPLEDNSVDIVASISTFEHVDFFWETFTEILRILKPHGLLFLNVPSNGPFHRHDVDNWRFYPDAGGVLVKWGKKKGFNPELLESFTHNYSGNEGTNDFVGVFIKDSKFKENYSTRIIDQFKNFRNGKTDRDDNIINFKRLTQDQDNWGWSLFFKLNKFIYKLKKKFYEKTFRNFNSEFVVVQCWLC